METEIKFSDHSLIRYLERIRKLDLQLIKNNILTSDIQQQILNNNGKGKFDTATCTITVIDYTIVTITPKEKTKKFFKKVKPQQPSINQPDEINSFDEKNQRIIQYYNKLKYKKRGQGDININI